MTFATHPLSWIFGMRPRPARRAIERGAPEPRRRSPVFIQDAVLPCGGETMLLKILRTEDQPEAD